MLKEIRIMDFVEDNLELNPKANKDILHWIASFVYRQEDNIGLTNTSKAIIEHFSSGYCYHFAIMLNAIFAKGTVCWAAPFDHIVWVDKNNIPYDVTGAFVTNAKCLLIPIEYMGELLNEFKHVGEHMKKFSNDDILNIIRDYLVIKDLSDEDIEVEIENMKGLMVL